MPYQEGKTPGEVIALAQGGLPLVLAWAIYWEACYLEEVDKPWKRA